MYSPDTLKIDLKALKEDCTSMEFRLSDDYFEAIEAPEVSKGNIYVKLDICKTAEDYFDFHFHVHGVVTVQCDRCLDDMDQDVEADNRLVVRLGEEDSEEDDLVIVDKDEAVVDVAWYIYESVALSIPIKHVHAPGKCNRAMIEMLEQHSATRSSDGDDEKTTDPRWSELEKLKQIIKD